MSGPSKFTTETTKTENGVSLKITREPNEAPDDTYFGAAKQIEAVPPEGQDGLTRLQVIEAIVKRLGHYEKLSVFQKIHRYLNSSPDFLKNLVECKLETHRDFSSRPLDMQIWNRGRWVKEASNETVQTGTSSEKEKTE